eukprot:TRINITY_DN17457_c0_g1_i2.p1 TRINITY_DN17457_c0_g1~~TRINITY_DN17457_c0_g1_i2.p1  ORF type:complete len:208 (-),score=39.66 TRINITY_DN17457_c0_g1_i2:197-820(-)
MRASPCPGAGAAGMAVAEEYAREVHTSQLEYHKARTGGTLLRLQFTTLFEYLQLLRLVAEGLQLLGRRALVYLAAAVSDFYVPWSSLGEHKIQSAGGPLDMHLAQVPKMIPPLRRTWAPQAFTVSFKLETDREILLSKAQEALRKNLVHAVVANELLSRKERVIVVASGESTTIERDEHRDVEEPLVQRLIGMHEAYLKEKEDDVKK